MKFSFQLSPLTGAAILLAAALTACGGGSTGGAEPNTGAVDVPNGGGDDSADGGSTDGGSADAGSVPDVATVGALAPEVAGEFVTGEGAKSVAEGKGKVVIVDFWATYCAPCRKSFPKYQAIADKHGGEVQVIGVSVDDPDDVSAEDVAQFAKDTGVSFSVIWDKEKATAGKYNPPKMPTSYVIDKEGVLRHVHAGFEGGEDEEIGKEVEALLK